MIRLFLLAVLVGTMFGGCFSSGSREYKTGQGWTPTLPPPLVPTP